MLNEKVVALLNDQINKEFYSAYLYLDFSNFYSDKGLDGFANWYRIQAQEERDHALLFYDYLQDNDEAVRTATLVITNASGKSKSIEITQKYNSDRFEITDYE